MACTSANRYPRSDQTPEKFSVASVTSVRWFLPGRSGWCEISTHDLFSSVTIVDDQATKRIDGARQLRVWCFLHQLLLFWAQQASSLP
jgi:hypothetical protein